MTDPLQVRKKRVQGGWSQVSEVTCGRKIVPRVKRKAYKMVGQYDVWFGNGRTNKQTRGRDENVKILPESDQNRQ